MTSPDSPSNLSDALTALGDLMEAHAGSLNHFGFAHLMSRVVDGPDASPHKATRNPSLQSAMVKALAPMGFISPVPTVQQVRDAAKANA